MDNIIDRLASDLIAAKAQRDKISEVIASIENSIVSQLGAKEEGSTTFKGDKYTVTTTGKFYYKVDEATLNDIRADLGSVASVVFRRKHEVAMSAFRKLAELDPKQFEIACKAVTTQPAKTTVQVKAR